MTRSRSFRTAAPFILALAAASSFGQRILPVGTWKYDVATLRVVPNAAATKNLNDVKRGPEMRDMFAKLKKQLIEILKPVRLTLSADHKVRAYSSADSSVANGTWSLSGRTIKIVMADASQRTPDMTLDPRGKAIRTKFIDARFGAGLVDMVRAK